MKPIQYKMINDLVDGKTVMVEDCHRLSSPNFTGYVIATMTHGKTNMPVSNSKSICCM